MAEHEMGRPWDERACRVKVCGLTRPDDALLAVRLGAWAVGVVFAPSPRRVSHETALELARAVAEERKARPGAGRVGLPGLVLPLVVGVFGDSNVTEIVEVAREVGLDAVQLHGEGGPEALAVRKAMAELERRRGSRVFVIRAVPVEPELADWKILRARMEAAYCGADLVLLDTRVAGGFGGTGKKFDWDMARQAGRGLPFLVAGGIGPHNLRDAVCRSGALGADVSSGVERSCGVKDHLLMEQLLAEAQRLSMEPGRREAIT